MRIWPRWRRFALALFGLGCAGAGAELLLLGHYEDPWQWSPLVLLGAGLAAAAWLSLRPGRAATRAFQWLMAAFLVVGCVGVYLHLESNFEFERELNPALAGRELWREVWTGAMPALAPAMMGQLGLLGLLLIAPPAWIRASRKTIHEKD